MKEILIMDPKIKKLQRYIDEILIWAQENPGIEVPNKEIGRLLIALENIWAKTSISTDLWLLIKPIKPSDPLAADQRLKEVKQNTIKKIIKDTQELNKDLIEETKKLKEQIEKIKHPYKRI